VGFFSFLLFVPIGLILLSGLRIFPALGLGGLAGLGPTVGSTLGALGTGAAGVGLGLAGLPIAPGLGPAGQIGALSGFGLGAANDISAGRRKTWGGLLAAAALAHPGILRIGGERNAGVPKNPQVTTTSDENPLSGFFDKEEDLSKAIRALGLGLR